MSTASPLPSPLRSMAGEWRKDGVRLNFDRTGSGMPLVFGHGLGGSRMQVGSLLAGLTGVERLTAECRGHGLSELGPPSGLALQSFARDTLDLTDRLGWRQAVWGGVSMGAAVALHAAILRPDAVSGLVLVRPAWATGGPPQHLAILAELGRLMTARPPDEARQAFVASPAYSQILQSCTDNAASLLGQFEASDLQERGILLARLAGEALDIPPLGLASLDLPVLIVATEEDAMHPVWVAHELAETLPRAQLVSVTSKSRDLQRHRRETAAAVQAFLDASP